MRFIQPLTISCFIVVAFAPIPTRGQAQELFDQASLREEGSLSPEQQAMLRARHDVIIGEAARFANEWVGTYVMEDGLTSGAQLDWAPTNGFLIWWSTCSHGWRDRVNFGRVDFRDGVLRVISELSREGEKVFAVSGDLVTVKWGEQHYLVPVDQLIVFCYAARNAGRSTEINQFFLKQSDREKRRFGLPAVPLAYKKYLVSSPIQARIIEVKPQTEPASQTFTLNAGRTAGVVVGMKFFAMLPRNVHMLVEIIEVRDTNSEAFVNMSRFKNDSEREVKPRIGWKLTSRAPRIGYDFP